MGRLIPVSAFYGDHPTEDATWYAPTLMGYGNRARNVDWAAAFPHVVAMHFDLLHPDRGDHNSTRRSTIRRWIEVNLICTVILARKDMSYRYYFKTDKLFPDTYERHHGYHLFRFEELADATLFSLNFSEWVSRRFEEEHPGYPESEGFIRYDPSRGFQ